MQSEERENEKIISSAVQRKIIDKLHSLYILYFFVLLIL